MRLAGLWHLLARAWTGLPEACTWPSSSDFVAPPGGEPATVPARLARDGAAHTESNTVRPTKRDREALSAECDAFVTGRYHRILLDRHQLFPDWAWINLLAHADCEELERLAGMTPTRHSPLAVLSYLANDLLTAVGRDDRALRELQERTLVPLELSLLAPPAGATSLSQLVKTVDQLLDRQCCGKLRY